MKKLRLLSLFSGIGAPERALDTAGIPFELVAYCEIDKYAAKSYSLLHHVPESMNLGDITKIVPEELPDFDMVFHGSPCQSFSVAGRGEGGEKGSGTRSSLLWNTVEIVKVKKPKFVLWENVPNVLSPKHLPVFQEYLAALDEMGYESTFDVLNAKDYGVPQNRERIFCISRLREDD
ncbi:DNA cytosine methyltransferase [Selenomonas ruminantium]|uniref:DNA cytosine methyltransferase n=1 Tax=Selenomonas ruminantium TaxID=971 RepID=UPI0026F153FF|nr:DNA cytosine methyltransferase [Selenomonas ruminantium]